MTDISIRADRRGNSCSMKPLMVFLILLMTVVWPCGSFAQEQTDAQAASEQIDTGTNPTKLSNTAGIQYKHTELTSDFSQQLLEVYYKFPLGEKQRTSLNINVPFMRFDVPVYDDAGLGDVSVKLTNVSKLTRAYGIVFSGELFFDTAKYPALGNGQTALKASGIYAKFLKSGGIFAPALVHMIGLGGHEDGSRINNTTFDFYYVPKLSNPFYYMTYDPAIVLDWLNDAEYASLTVTFGRVIGKLFGGTGSVYVKPQILAGSERAADWSLQAGFKVVGF